MPDLLSIQGLRAGYGEAVVLPDMSLALVTKAYEAVLGRPVRFVDWDAAAEAQDEALINSLSMVLPFSSGDRQALLESPTLADRRELLQGLIEFALHGGDTEDRLQ